MTSIEKMDRQPYETVGVEADFCGVVNFSLEDCTYVLRVNSEDVLEIMRDEVEKLGLLYDNYKNFAGKVTISIEGIRDR